MSTVSTVNSTWFQVEHVTITRGGKTILHRRVRGNYCFVRNWISEFLKAQPPHYNELAIIAREGGTGRHPVSPRFGQYYLISRG